MNKKGIYSERCWIDGKLRPATILFDAGKIVDVRASHEKGEHIEDLGRALIMPGVIDSHVHVNEPGRTEWEGFETTTMAAAAGGITSIVDMPLNASPVTISKEALFQKLLATQDQLHVNLGLYGGLIPGSYEQIEGLVNEGVWGIKVFLTHSGIEEFPNVSEKELHEVMPFLASRGIPLLVHCELTDDDRHEELSRHPQSYSAYLQSRPKEWEDKAVAMMIRLCRLHRCKVHIVHVSSANALIQIEEAKATGLPLTAETCPHYILFSAEEIRDGDTLFKCAPPIREQKNNYLLKKALADGILDFISSDHSPAPPAIKELASGNLIKAWGGIAGLQFLLPASWTALKDQMILEKFIPLLTEAPSRFLGLQYRKGFIRNGYDADLVAWMPEENFVVNQAMIFHKHKISPYVSQRLYGKTLGTYVGGEKVFDGGQIIKRNQGTMIKAADRSHINS